ncbi:MAG TPA: hypothetical protein PKV40_09505, partial [Candidatus Kapabacteria bacterium]|nr:hypothetical protein [Candidatus Kapabacteria bacterium]
FRYKKAFLQQLPIPEITEENAGIVREIEERVDRILAGNKSQNVGAIGDDGVGAIRELPLQDKNEQIQSTATQQTLEREIDELVYKLYGLTEEERRVVEGEGNS